MKQKFGGIVICVLFIGASILPNISGSTIEQKDNFGISTSTVDWWSMFYHDPNHSGYSSSIAPETNNILWSSTICEPFKDLPCSPAVIDGKVYIGSDDKKLYCLNAETGTKIWDYLTGSDIYSTPAIANGKVYFCSEDDNPLGDNLNVVFCLNANTGEKIWSYETEYSRSISSPIIADGKVFIGDTQSCFLYCLNAETGKKIWDFYAYRPIECTPSVVDGKVYFCTHYDWVYCLDASNADILWSFDTGGHHSITSPMVVEKRVYIGTSSDDTYEPKLYCLNADTGLKIWDLATSSDVRSYAIVNTKLLVNTGNYTCCLDAYTGEKIWESVIPGYGCSVADGKIYIDSWENDDYKICCLNIDTGTKIWEYSTDYSLGLSPAIANGKLYVHSGDGKVYCFGDNSGNQPPPTITGPSEGTAGVTTNYNFIAIDPQGDDVSYFIDWGDTTNSGWIGPYHSGEQITESHIWSTKGTYSLTAKVKDIYGNESNWATLTVTMPCSYDKPLLQFMELLFQQFPNAFPLLRQLMS